MKKICVILILSVFSFGNAIAGPDANNLTQCLVGNTTAGDKEILTRWVFATLAKHPNLATNPNMSDLASVAQRVRSGADREMAQLVEKFIYDKCNSQLKAALKNEGPMAIQTSIRSYVEQTGREILQHPSVAGSIGGVASQMDAQKLLQALMGQ